MAEPTPSSAPLLPCPFCGASARGYEIGPHQHSAALLALVPDMPKEHHGSYVIEGNCQCGSGLIGDNQAEVTARWNSRALLKTAGGAISVTEVELTPEQKQGFISKCKGPLPGVAAQAPAAVAVPDERAAFEKWARQQPWIKDCQRDSEGVYGHYESQKAWATWKQARAALSATPALPATEDSSAGDLAEVVHASTYVQPVPDHCDRIVWRGQYIHLPIAQAEVQAEPVALPFAILDEEMIAFRRFDECARDGQGYDVRKPMMKRLAEIGLVRRVSADIYEHTTFGCSVIHGDFDTAPQAQPADALDAEIALCQVLHAVQRYLPPDGITIDTAMNEIITAIDPWPIGRAKEQS